MQADINITKNTYAKVKISADILLRNEEKPRIRNWVEITLKITIKYLLIKGLALCRIMAIAVVIKPTIPVIKLNKLISMFWV